MRSSYLTALILLAASLAGCDLFIDDLGAKGKPCYGDGSCAAGLVCDPTFVCVLAAGDGDQDVDTDSDPDDSTTDPEPDIEEQFVDVLDEAPADGDESGDDPVEEDPADDDPVADEVEQFEESTDTDQMESDAEADVPQEGVDDLDIMENPTGSCYIDGVWRPLHDTGPAMCLWCDPAGSGGVNGWSVVVGACYIDGVCYQNNDARPGDACQWCDVSFSVVAWSAAPDYQRCDDCSWCVGAECTAIAWALNKDPFADCGVCQVCDGLGGCAAAADATDPKDECAASDNPCDATTCQQGNCSWPDNTSCDDPYDCAASWCQQGDCVTDSVSDGWCFIDQTCVADGQTDVAFPCRSCASATDQRAWSDSPDETLCDVCAWCSAGDCVKIPAYRAADPGDDCETCHVCDGLGGCAAADDGSDPKDECDGDGVCQSDACLAGRCYYASTTACDDGTFCTTSDHCAEGVCTGTPFACEHGDCTAAGACSCLTGWTGAACDACDAANGYVAFEGGCAPSEPDYDHDGVCVGLACATVAQDACPTVWTPDNNPGACPEWATVDQGWARTRVITLRVNGGDPTARRTHEPVEIPLVNGFLDASVAGCWSFDSGSGADSSLRQHHAAVSGATAAAGVDNVAGALSFNGLTNYVKVADADHLDFDGDFSIMLWVKPSRFEATGSTLAGKFSGTLTHYGWRLKLAGVGNTVSFDVADGGDTGGLLNDGVYSTDQSSTALGVGLWYHLAARRVGALLELWIDGRLEAYGAAPAGGVANSADLYIGCAKDSILNSFFAGVIDDVVALNRAVTPQEIAAAYASGASYGKRLAPGAQADWDDLRVTEATALSGPHPLSHLVPHEVVGTRPHSDSPCPAAYNDLAISLIPFIADREDLCGVVGYWKLDGGLLDSSGKDQHGTNQGTGDAPGRFGDSAGAAEFYGYSWVSIPGSPALRPDTAVTLEAWVFPSVVVASGKTAAIINNYESSGMGLALLAGNIPSFSAYNAAGVEFHIAATSGIPAGRWTHLAGVFDGYLLRLYVNGMASGHAEFAGPIHHRIDIPLALGANPNTSGGATDFFTGVIDEAIVHGVAKSGLYFQRRAALALPLLRFLASTEPTESAGKWPWYNYALRYVNAAAVLWEPVTAGRNLATYGASCYGLLSSCVGYAGWWRFNEGAGSTALDASASGANGALTMDAAFGAGSEGGGVWTDGQGDAVSVEVTSVFARGLVGDHTVESLVYAPATPATAYVADRAATGESISARRQPHGLMFDEQGIPIFSWIDDAGRALTAGLSTPPLHQWVALAGVRDVAAGTGVLYVQGIKVNTTRNSVGAGVLPNRCVIGNNSFGGSNVQGFNGGIDQVRLMNRALAPDELLGYPLATWILEPASP